MAVEVGVTMYCTVPAALLPGFDKVCAMVEPEPATAPVIPPVTVPIVQLNVAGAVAVSAMLVAELLQIVVAAAVVITGLGFTVTVMVYGAPGQFVLAVDTGVTMYCTVPATALPGLFSVCAIVAPLPALAPVMPPVMVPTVQLNVLAADAVSEILVALPLQIAAVFAVVTTGVGFTVTVMVYGVPGQPGVAVEVGVTIY